MIRIIDNSMKRITLLTYFSFALLISYSQIGYKYQNKVIELYPDTTSHRSSGYVIPMPLMAEMLSAKNEFNQVRQ